MFKLKTGVLIALFALGVSASAHAAPFTGGFSKAGVALPIDAAGNLLPDFEGAVALDFTLFGGLDPTPGVAGQILVLTATGAFVPLSGQIGTITDFTFDGAAVNANYPTAPIASFELVGGVTFDLTDVTSVLRPLDNQSVEIRGTGLFTGLGFDATPGTYIFTAQTAGQGSFSFSASQAADVDVPEPASLGLLGIGLFGAAAAARRRRVRA